MDSPERSSVAAGASLAKFEDSPVFNFLNNLSPIQPVKSVHSIHAYTSPGFSSISSVFSSPHVNLQRESRFVIRHSYSEASKQDNLGEDDLGSNLCTEDPDCGLSTAIVYAQESRIMKCSLNEATVDPPDECLALTSRLPEPLQYACSSPDHNIKPCYGVKLDLKLDIGCLEDKRKILFADETMPAKKVTETTKEEVPESDWENVYTVADDLLLFDDSTESEACEGQNARLEDKETSEQRRPGSPFGHCLENTVYDSTSNYIEDAAERDETNQSVISGSSQDQAGVDSQQQRGIRRRCLVFDASGASKKTQNVSDQSFSDSMVSSMEFVSNHRPLAFVKPGASPSPCVLPGIGLHLNSLASNSRDRMVTQEALTCERRLMSGAISVGSFPPGSAHLNSLNQSLSAEKDQDSIYSDAQNSQIMLHNAMLTPELGGSEELSQSSSKNKKRKPDSSGEGEACKRCNCKKSKCLKLYCECFAAGVYCIESCSCQECYNKPIHEDTVMATRKQIETRNPLAFAPKVVRSSEAVPDMREETNSTPASARHKRGCNCKKSSCLKKYCECFQGGVGCSISCRCEGCKNAYGVKDVSFSAGVVPMGTEEMEPVEEVNACGKELVKFDDVQAFGVVQMDAVHAPENIVLTTPRQTTRTSSKKPNFSNRKPPRSTALPIEYTPIWDPSQMHRKSEVTLPQGEFGNLDSLSQINTPEILRGNASPDKIVKSTSPNSKRVSPPHIGMRLSPSCKGGRKLILKSIPSFPSLNGNVNDE